jgi:hypothetical protein
MRQDREVVADLHLSEAITALRYARSWLYEGHSR